MDLVALGISLKLASLTTLILGALGIPVAFWISQLPSKQRWWWETLLSLPLVLPPTVMGFFLLLLFSSHSPVGKAYETIVGHSLVFTFSGILAGSVFCNIPYAVRPFIAAFQRIPRSWIEASLTLGESMWGTFWRVLLPCCWPGILSGFALTFAHSLGEFGVVLMLGGNIPGSTRTLSLSIYDHVQSFEYQVAALSSVVLAITAFVILGIIQRYGGNEAHVRE